MHFSILLTKILSGLILLFFYNKYNPISPHHANLYENCMTECEKSKDWCEILYSEPNGCKHDNDGGYYYISSGNEKLRILTETRYEKYIGNADKILCYEKDEKYTFYCDCDDYISNYILITSVILSFMISFALIYELKND